MAVPLLVRGEAGLSTVTCPACGLDVLLDATAWDPDGLRNAIRRVLKLAPMGIDLVGVLGAGGMAYLYSAIHRATGELVVIKMLPPSMMTEPVLLERFRREVRAMRAINHPHVMRVIEVGLGDVVPWMAIPYQPGRTLRNILNERGQLGLRELFAVVGPLAEALHAVHRAGFLHRDVKPSNVMINSRGEVLLFDFGVAHAANTPHDLTSDPVGLGTSAYNAPEIYEHGSFSARSDQYALAVTIYELLTARLPMGVFRGPRAYSPDLPAECEEALFQALQHDPGDRHPSVEAFARAFLRPLLARYSEQGALDGVLEGLAELPRRLCGQPPRHEALDEEVARLLVDERQGRLDSARYPGLTAVRGRVAP
jgi:serine/threonine-protein kinase